MAKWRVLDQDRTVLTVVRAPTLEAAWLKANGLWGDRAQFVQAITTTVQTRTIR